ncbi:hypothetical protein [Candidatus Tisiphia endosymbiont of Sialis lutaria]|uniref:hypothetical protein n=1 Tax=Candidatus Tisiphia endosymbiont of Sialis lutaria TaxID=2029164 RepID=UPI00312CAA75
MSKTVPIDYYRDLEDPECLNSQYYDDDKNFANLSTTLQFLHLAETMAEYGKEALEGKQLEAAKNFGFVTDHSNPDNSNPDNSWFTTVANAFSSIPKEHIFFATLLATSHAAHAYRHVTFNTPDNSNADNFDTENSNVVHHRSARAAGDIPISSFVDLDNENCFFVGLHRSSWNRGSKDTINTRCSGEPCIHRENSQLTPWVAKHWWEYNIGLAEPKAISGGKVQMDYTYNTPNYGWGYDIKYGSEVLSCNEPLTPFYSHYKESTNLYQSKQFTEAMTEIELALKEEPNNQLAINRNNLLRELVKTTTTEPSSSTSEASSTTTSTTPEKITETSLTSLITEASTTKENSSTAMPKDNTTQAEPSTPTAPQDQTTPSAEDQGWLWNKVVAPIAETAAAVVTTAVIAYALHKLRQCYNKNKTKEELDVELKNFYEPSLLKLVDQIIPINDNDYTDGIQDLLVPLAGTGNLDSDLNSAAA